MSIGASMQPQASDEDELLQGFLDRAIHDLRASVRHIGISSELLCESLPADISGSDPNLRRLCEGVAGLTSLVAGMSSYSTALSVANYTFRRVNLRIPLYSAVTRLQQSISLAGATVVYDGLPEVQGDADRLSEVFQRLIDNALKYRGEAAPRIEVEAKKEPGSWRVSVRDNGVGFEPKYQVQVFNPFYRLHGPEIPGVGLGLAVCQRIMKAHQGRIWIESAKGSGTTCFLTLPTD